MQVSSISQITTQNFQQANRKKRAFRNYVSWSGYGAVAAGVASGVAAHYKKIKLHKELAYLSAALTLLHIGIVEWKKFQYRQFLNKQSN